jgi:hypothetical protein
MNDLTITQLAEALTSIAAESNARGTIPPYITVVNHGGWKYNLILTPR